MKLKNYTTTIAPEKTIYQIEQKLLEMGATGIMKEYADKRVVGIKFQVEIQGHSSMYALPCRADNAYEVLRRLPGFRSRAPKTVKDQAERTAWRILLNWVEVQTAIIQLGQSTADEVFLPYMLTRGGQTVYQRFVQGNLLGSGDAD